MALGGVETGNMKPKEELSAIPTETGIGLFNKNLIYYCKRTLHMLRLSCLIIQKHDARFSLYVIISILLVCVNKESEAR